MISTKGVLVEEKKNQHTSSIVASERPMLTEPGVALVPITIDGLCKAIEVDWTEDSSGVVSSTRFGLAIPKSKVIEDEVFCKRAPFVLIVHETDAPTENTALPLDVTDTEDASMSKLGICPEFTPATPVNLTRVCERVSKVGAVSNVVLVPAVIVNESTHEQSKHDRSTVTFERKVND